MTKELNEITKTVKRKRFIILPFLVWYVWTVFIFLKKDSILNDYDDADNWVYVLIALIIQRILLGMWIMSIARRYDLKETIWVVLSFIFGVPMLLFINIRIWVKKNK